MKNYYPVRREQSESPDIALIGGSAEGLLCALSLSHLDSVNVKVSEFCRAQLVLLHGALKFMEYSAAEATSTQACKILNR